MPEYQGYVFEKLKIPCHVFVENVNPGFGYEDVIVSYRFDPQSFRWNEAQEEWLYDPEFELPSDILAHMKELVEKKRKDAEARGARFYDGQMVKLLDYEVIEKKRLFLELGPTSFFTYQATNFSLDQRVLKDEKGNLTTLREKYRINLLNLNDILANPIGVSANIISEPDNAVVLVKRSEELAQYPGLYGVGAAGFMDRISDTSGGVPNPFKTIQREVKEERGIECDLNDFKLFSVGRALDDLHVELFGELRTDYTVDEIKSAPKKDEYETKSLFEVEFEPKEVLKYLTRTINEVPKGVASPYGWVIGESPKWVPAHAVAMIQSLIKEYGNEKVKKIG